jgi:hypothetical protein
MSGVPPSGARSTRGFLPLAKPVTGLRPLGSRSLTLSSHPSSPPGRRYGEASLPRLPHILDRIKPPRTLIVLNEWGFEAVKARATFASILANRVVAAAQADGARIVTMPHLDDAEELDAIRARRGDGVTDARTDRSVLSAWLNRMEENFAPIADGSPKTDGRPILAGTGGRFLS